MRSVPFPLVLWSVQNRCYDVLQTIHPQAREKAAHDKAGARWVAQFQELAGLLQLRVELSVTDSKMRSKGALVFPATATAHEPGPAGINWDVEPIGAVLRTRSWLA